MPRANGPRIVIAQVETHRLFKIGVDRVQNISGAVINAWVEIELDEFAHTGNPSRRNISGKRGSDRNGSSSGLTFASASSHGRSSNARSSAAKARSRSSSPE